MELRIGKILFYCQIASSPSEECALWAQQAISSGYDSPSLYALSRQTGPLFSDFEIRTLVRKAVAELGIRTDVDPLLLYCKELLDEVLKDTQKLSNNLKTINEIYSRHGNREEILDFYLLSFAIEDLKNENEQHYWPNATRSNIHSIILDRSEKWIKEMGGL